MDYLELALRLVVATVLGAAIGLERERKNHSAGLRTHMLVCLGSSLVMIVSVLVAGQIEGLHGDPTRIAAQVVSGIGFLGAGTILREGLTIRGLTTAASLWLAAALGLAAGAGLYLVAVVTTAIGLATLAAFSAFERRWFSSSHTARVVVTSEDRPGQLGRIADAMGRHRLNIFQVHLEPESEGLVDIAIQVRIEAGANLDAAVQELSSLPGVRRLIRE